MSIPVKQVNGIGPKTNEYLQAKGIATVNSLIKFGVKKLSQAPGFSEGRASNVIEAAKELLGKKSTKPKKKDSKKSDKKKDKKNTKAKKDKKSGKKSKDKKKDKKGKGKKGKK